MGLVQCGATGPSVFIDSDTETVILFPDQLQRGRKPFLVSLLYSAIVSIICSALGSLPSLGADQCRLFWLHGTLSKIIAHYLVGIIRDPKLN